MYCKYFCAFYFSEHHPRQRLSEIFDRSISAVRRGGRRGVVWAIQSQRSILKDHSIFQVMEILWHTAAAAAATATAWNPTSMDAASFSHGLRYQTVSLWCEEEERSPWDFSFLVTVARCKLGSTSLPNQPSPGSFFSSLLYGTSHGSPVGAVCVHVDRMCCYPHGCSCGEPQPVHLRAHHPAHVSGAALQLHLHAQHTEPLRPANRRARHGGTVHIDKKACAMSRLFCAAQLDLKQVIKQSIFLQTLLFTAFLCLMRN